MASITSVKQPGPPDRDPSDDERAVAVVESLPVAVEDVDASAVVEEEDLSGDLPANLRLHGIRKLISGSLKVKIIAPYLLIMLITALLGTFVVLRLLVGSLEQRFTNQLQDAGKSVNDSVIKTESGQLELIRLMANTEGVDTAVSSGDVATLQRLLVPLQANSQYSFVDVLDKSGKSVLMLRPNAQTTQTANGGQVDPKTQVDPAMGSWDISTKVLAGTTDDFGDKYTGLEVTPFGPMLYSSGPVKDTGGKVVGAILVGSPFSDLLKQLGKDVLTSVTVYSGEGAMFGTTLPLKDTDTPPTVDPALLAQLKSQDASNQRVIQRQIIVDGEPDLELLGGLVIRDKVEAVLGVAVPRSFIDKSGEETRIQLAVMFSVVVCFVLLVGLLLARRITQPVMMLVQACRAVARGNLDLHVDVRSSDETGMLAHRFNMMIEGLKERERIRDTFGRYMTKQVSDAILNSDEINLGGQVKHLTMLMSDIRGFTTLSEAMPADELVAFLNRYFSSMVDCVIKNEGVVDKFMGDAILVVYGAPIDVPNHAEKAVLTALDMRSRLVDFNEELIRLGYRPIRIGVGVNTGDAVTGNIGSEVRMEYTVIGDTVNATQRVEDLTKEFKTDILISDSTKEDLTDRIVIGEEFVVTLRGRQQETHVYTVLGVKDGEHATHPGSSTTDLPPLSLTPAFADAIGAAHAPESKNGSEKKNGSDPKNGSNGASNGASHGDQGSTVVSGEPTPWSATKAD